MKINTALNLLILMSGFAGCSDSSRDGDKHRKDDASRSDAAEAGSGDGSTVDAAMLVDADAGDASDLQDAELDDGSARDDAATDAGVGMYGASCEPSLPQADTSCATNEQLCTYGDEPRGECRPSARCTQGVWKVFAPDAAVCKPVGTGGTCPNERPQQNASCSVPARCLYADHSECQCASGNWLCDPPRTPSAGACPVEIPSAGTTCSPAMSCTYGCRTLTAVQVLATCTASGTWTWSTITCAPAGG